MHSASYTGLTVESVGMGHQSVQQDLFLELNKNRINTSFTTMPRFRSEKAAGFVASIDILSIIMYVFVEV